MTLNVLRVDDKTEWKNALVANKSRARICVPGMDIPTCQLYSAAVTKTLSRRWRFERISHFNNLQLQLMLAFHVFQLCILLFHYIAQLQLVLLIYCIQLNGMAFKNSVPV